MTWTLGTTAQEHLDEHNLFDHAGIATPTTGKILGVSGGQYTQVDAVAFATRIDNLDSPYTMQPTDEIILAVSNGGPITINLPSVPTVDMQSVLIKRVGANTVSIVRNGSDLIQDVVGDATSKSLDTSYAHWSGIASATDGNRWVTVGTFGTVT